MEVWRVQNDFGEGPYTGKSTIQGWVDCKGDLLAAHNGSDDHPSWMIDFVHAWDSSHWRAGFESKEDLIAWFGEFLNPGVLAYGFSIVTLEVDSLYVEQSWSGLQIRFNNMGIPGRQGSW